MARAVLGDHVLFRECMFYLRKDLYLEKQRFLESTDKRTFSCISTTFHITKIWDLGDFSISPSHEIMLPAARKSLISFIENPVWITKAGFEHPLLFGEVLSCLISFVSLLPVKSPRDSHQLDIQSLDSIPNSCVEDVALTLPFIWAGTGAHKSRLTEDEEDKLIDELRELIFTLNNIEEKWYSYGLEVIRLVHLSILVKRDDFGLAYLLLVSAIEAIAQKAIKRDSVKETHPKEKEWNEIASNNDEFKEVLKAYKDIRGRNEYLSKRFTEFILKFCPPDEWEDIVVSEYDSLDREWSDFMQGSQHPSLMEVEEIKDILSKAYDYRSRFVHNGTQPPHKYPNNPLNKFFEVIQNYDSYPYETQISPNYELMLAIAKHSIIKWLKTKVRKQP